MKNKTIFKNFGDYWSYAKYLSLNQRDVIMAGLPDKQREHLVSSFQSGGWEDLVIRDELSNIAEKIKEEMGLDLVFNRCKIMSGKSVFMRKSEWKYVKDLLESYKEEHTFFIIGNIKAEDIDDVSVLLVEDN